MVGNPKKRNCSPCQPALKILWLFPHRAEVVLCRCSFRSSCLLWRFRDHDIIAACFLDPVEGFVGSFQQLFRALAGNNFGDADGKAGSDFFAVEDKLAFANLAADFFGRIGGSGCRGSS